MLTPTPPWQQSLGLVTSSAEQEEDEEEGCTQEGDKSTAPHPALRGCKENYKVTEEELAPLLLLEHSVYGGPSFEKYPNLSVEDGAGNDPGLNTWFSSSQCGQKRCSPKAKEFSAGQLTRTFLSSSLAWDDLPFSESLTAFLCEENKDFDIDSDTKLICVSVQGKEEKARNHLGNTSLIRETSCQGNAQIPGRHLQMLLDVTNTPAAKGVGRHDSSSQECKHPVQRVSRSQTRNVFSHEHNQEDEAASSPPAQKEDEQQLEGDTYNCSADLFSSSLVIAVDSQRLSIHAKAIGAATEAHSPQVSKPHQQYRRSENVNMIQSTPDKQKLKSKFRQSLIPQETKDFDFVPPSQSTPIIKVGVAPHSPSLYKSTSEFSSQPDDLDLGVFYGRSHEIDSKNNSAYKLNSGNATQVLLGGEESTKENLAWSKTSSRHSHRLALKRFLKPVKHKSQVHSQQHPRTQGKALNMSISYKYESRVGDVRESDCEDSVVIVPPTPAGNVQISVPLRRRALTDNNLACTGEVQQRDEFNRNTTLLDQTLASSNRGVAQTENCDSETVSEGIFDHENPTCDWSKDLFSDTF